MESTLPTSNTSERLCFLISKYRIKQSDIARRTGLARSTICQWVNGTRVPNQRGLAKLGMALNVSEVWLMGYDVPMERNVNIPKTENIDEHIDLIEIYDSLNAESKEEFLSFGRYLLSKENYNAKKQKK